MLSLKPTCLGGRVPLEGRPLHITSGLQVAGGPGVDSLRVQALLIRDVVVVQHADFLSVVSDPSPGQQQVQHVHPVYQLLAVPGSHAVVVMVTKLQQVTAYKIHCWSKVALLSPSEKQRDGKQNGGSDK